MVILPLVPQVPQDRLGLLDIPVIQGARATPYQQAHAAQDLQDLLALLISKLALLAQPGLVGPVLRVLLDRRVRQGLQAHAAQDLQDLLALLISKLALLAQPGLVGVPVPRVLLDRGVRQGIQVHVAQGLLGRLDKAHRDLQDPPVPVKPDQLALLGQQDQLVI